MGFCCSGWRKFNNLDGEKKKAAAADGQNPDSVSVSRDGTGFNNSAQAAMISKQAVDSQEGEQVGKAKSRYVGVRGLNPLGLLLTRSNSRRRIPGIVAANHQSTQSGEVVGVEEEEKIHFPSVRTNLCAASECD